MNLELTGRTALITGAAGGIGAACAVALAREGARVRVTSRSADKLAALVAAIRADGGAADAVPGDLADPAFIAALTATAAPDLLIHSAGHHYTYARFHLAPPDDAARIWQIEVDAFVALARWALPEMMARRFGRVVAITSHLAHTGANGAAQHAGAKAALEGMIRGLAIEYGRFGVTANAVAPGFVDTSRMQARAGDAVDAAAAASHRANLARATSVKRLARPEEVADPVAFLCSPRASYINGTTLTVAGGAGLNNLW